MSITTESYFGPENRHQAKKTQRLRCIRILLTRRSSTTQKNLNPSVTLFHWLNAPKDTKLVFTNEQRTLPYKPAGGGASYPTPIYNFKYRLPIFGDDGPWTFTKTGKSGGVADWTTPERPIPTPVDDDDPVDPKPEKDEGMDSNLIVLAVVLMVAAAVAVNM